MSDFFDQLGDGLKDSGTAVAEFLPKFLGAMIILFLGWLIARFLRNLVKRLLDRESVNNVLDRAGIGGLLSEAGYSAANLIATLIYAVLMLTVFTLAAEALGVESIQSLLSKLVSFLPLLIAALVILVIAAAIGGFIADLLRPWGEAKEMEWVPTVARVALVVFGVLTALDVIGIGAITTRIYEFGLGAVAVATAIAFGVGGIDTAKLWWQKYLTPDTD